MLQQYSISPKKPVDQSAVAPQTGKQHNFGLLLFRTSADIDHSSVVRNQSNEAIPILKTCSLDTVIWTPHQTRFGRSYSECHRNCEILNLASVLPQIKKCLQLEAEDVRNPYDHTKRKHKITLKRSSFVVCERMKSLKFRRESFLVVGTPEETLTQ